MIDMTIIAVTDDELIEHFNNGTPVLEVARRFDVSERWLWSQWRRLRAEGRVLGKRPQPERYESYHSAKGPAIDSVEGRPSVMMNEFGDDRLLERLRQVHAEPRYDIPEALQRRSRRMP